jgi:hypothetical protein
MGQYFFKMSQAEKNDILDKHKTIYDGYVTEYGQQSNTQPLYVQDYANDKEGMVVSNKGVVKPYTNMGINESHTGLDMIADDPEHFTAGCRVSGAEVHEQRPSGDPDHPCWRVARTDRRGECLHRDLEPTPGKLGAWVMLRVGF